MHESQLGLPLKLVVLAVALGRAGFFCNQPGPLGTFANLSALAVEVVLGLECRSTERACALTRALVPEMNKERPIK